MYARTKKLWEEVKTGRMFSSHILMPCVSNLSNL